MSTTSDRRLIEVAFPLEQTSIDSVHEKSVRHGHISTLHIWPARRPLAASRAALIATLLPDPGTPEKRKELTDRLGGRVVKVLKKKQGPGGGEDTVVKETVGGILHWGRETTNKADLDFFREEIRKAYGGRAPRVLDPFAGGGAIPLEAMRLGCDVTAVDINPVAGFILRCTLEYPNKLAGQKRPLPAFVRGDRGFMEAFFKAQGMKPSMVRTQLRKLGLERTVGRGGQQDLADTQTGQPVELPIEPHTLDADLAWHVRAWGWWLLREARRHLGASYPTYAAWEPLKDVAGWLRKHPDQLKPLQLVPLSAHAVADVEQLNIGLPAEQIDDPRQARWVAKPTVAYLWARTVTCKHCRAEIPLLKTRWLAKKGNKRVLLTLTPNHDRTGVAFGVESEVPAAGGNNAQRREHDRRMGQGTMTRSGVWCPCCGRANTVALSMQDIRAEAIAGRLGARMTAVVVDGPSGKEYRLPTEHEQSVAASGWNDVEAAFESIPFGPPNDPMPAKEALGIRVALYGINQWTQMFTNRQLVTLAGVVLSTRRSFELQAQESPEWAEAVTAYLALAVDRLADYSSAVCSWHISGEKMRNTFARFALPMVWDFAEVNPFADTTGSYPGGIEWIARFIPSAMACSGPSPRVLTQSAIADIDDSFDAVVTDPPYYDAIPYSDLMDFFYVWLRRTTSGLTDEWTGAFEQPLGPKWDHRTQDGELIDESSRHGGDGVASKRAYEQGMARAFATSAKSLDSKGRLVVVFANKQPAAWETLVTGLISAGFTVDGSWPIQTEMGNRQRALAAAALASSVWLVCKKRPATALAGWDNTVLAEMKENIRLQLRDFWDAGIQGPDFVWAATGPALEAFSKHRFVKKANSSTGETLSVGEFLRAVRRLVVEFVVGRVLGEAAHVGGQAADQAAAGLDDVTTYYLLHRYDFRMSDAPAGACILYSLSCNLSESDLADRYDLLLRSGGLEAPDEDDEEEDADQPAEEAAEGSGSTFRLKAWKQRRRPSLGYDPIAEQTRQRQKDFDARGDPLFDGARPIAVTGSRTIPLIDSIHRLMHLWVAADVNKVNEYLDDRGLRRSETFRQVLQALIELAEAGSEERSVLESLSNHMRVLGERADTLLDSLRG